MTAAKGAGPRDWRERYEIEARSAAEALQDLSEAQLLERISKDRLDPYFATWRAIGRRGTAKGSALVLWEYLRSHPGDVRMLHRYHCAEALFRILGEDDPTSTNELRRRVQWDTYGEDARQEALQELRQHIARVCDAPGGAGV